MKKLLSIIFYLFFLNFVYVFTLISGSCSSGQIDINSASSDELQKIIQIGPAYAEQIIALRPFTSLDELTKVSGIAEKRLDTIKSQEIACVDNFKEEISNEEGKENSDEKNKEKEFIPISSESYGNENIEEKQEQKNEVIKLNPKTIKTEDNVYEEDNKKLNDYALYLFFAFSLVILILVILKKNSI